MWRWAFVDRFRLSLAEYDRLSLDEFETGIAYIEKTRAAAQQQ